MFRKRIDVTLEALQGILLELWTEAVEKSVIKSLMIVVCWFNDYPFNSFLIIIFCFVTVLYVKYFVVPLGDFKT